MSKDKIEEILKGDPVPDPAEPKQLKTGDPLPPLDTLAKLRGFIPCRHGLSWQWMQDVTGQLGKRGHTLTINRAWTHPTAAAHSIGRVRPEHWVGGPFVVVGNIVLGEGSLEFCKAVKTLLDEGQLQPLPGGLMQHAMDPVTGYWYQTYNDRMSMDPAKTHHGPPKLPGLQVTITPGD